MGRAIRMAATLPTLLALGCITLNVSEIPTIEVPENLNANQVEYAILAALADRPPPEELAPGERIADHVYKAWFGPRYRSVQSEKERWFLEERAPGRIVAGYQFGIRYVRVNIDHDGERVTFDPVETRRLRRYGNRVQEAVVFWIEDLEVAIRRSLGSLSAEGR